jgi:hypothetical protein
MEHIEKENIRKASLLGEVLQTSTLINIYILDCLSYCENVPSSTITNIPFYYWTVYPLSRVPNEYTE